MSDLVRLEFDERDGGRVAVLTLDDPARRNALSLDMTLALVAAVDAAVADPAVGALVVTAVPPVFSAGGSVDDLLHPRAPLEETYAGVLRVAEAPVPTITAVNGPAIGAGVTLALAGDLVLCTPTARFDPRFLDVGLHPGGGVLWRLRERGGRQAAAATVLFGEAPAGEEAVRAGFAWRCLPDAELLPAALALAHRAAARPRELVAQTKATLDATAAVDDNAAAVALELEPQRASMTAPPFLARLAALRTRLGRDQGS